MHVDAGCNTNHSVIFGRPFVKRFTLGYRTVVCLFCLSVTLVYCGQTVGWIKMKLGMQVGVGTGHVERWRPRSPPQRDTAPARWIIKMPLDTKLGLGAGHIVLDGDPAAPLAKEGA